MRVANIYIYTESIQCTGYVNDYVQMFREYVHDILQNSLLLHLRLMVYHKSQSFNEVTISSIQLEIVTQREEEHVGRCKK